MNIDKAIEHLKDIGLSRGTLSEDDLEAIKLGTEALKRLSMNRITDCPHIHSPLRGETKD